MPSPVARILVQGFHPRHSSSLPDRSRAPCTASSCKLFSLRQISSGRRDPSSVSRTRPKFGAFRRQRVRTSPPSHDLSEVLSHKDGESTLIRFLCFERFGEP